MKQTSRKKVLVSSVAMMMVATVSLGSATFAWFSQNTKATASGITAQTTQSSNIVLSETGNGTDWTDKLEFKTYASDAMNPVSPLTQNGNNFSKWVTTMADAKDAGVKGAGAEYTDATKNSDYTATKLYMKYETSETTATQAVKISFNVTDSLNGQSTEDFLRVALVPADDATKAIAGNNAYLVWGTAADDFALDHDAYVYNENELASNKDKTITNITGEKTLVSSATLAANTVYQFDVYVWYEGTDPQCIDSNAVNDLGITFNVEKA